MCVWPRREWIGWVGFGFDTLLGMNALALVRVGRESFASCHSTRLEPTTVALTVHPSALNDRDARGKCGYRDRVVDT